MLVFGSILLLSGIFMRVIYSPERLSNTVKNVRNDILTLRDGLVQLPGPTQIQPQERDATVSYQIDQLQQFVDKQYSPPKLPNTALIKFNLLINKQNISLVDGVDRSIDDEFKLSNNLATYHLATISALKNILEYKPSADFAHVGVGDDTIQQRIKLLNDGTTTTKNQLTALQGSFADDKMDELLSILDKYATSQKDFTDIRQLDSLEKATIQTQQAIIINRQWFWSTSLSTILSDIDETNSQLANIETILGF